MARAKATNGKGRGSARPPTGRSRGHIHPVKPQWQLDVKAELKRRLLADVAPRNPKELAEVVKCAQSTMHDMLNLPNAKGSHLVPRVHEALGWPPPPDLGRPAEPSPPLPSADAIEMAKMYDMLPEDVRRSMRDQAAAILALLNKNQPNPE